VVYVDIRKIWKGYLVSIETILPIDDDSLCFISNHRRSTMKPNVHFTLVLAGLLCAASLLFTTPAQPAASETHTFSPDSIPYGPPPPFLAAGAQIAVLEGNPGASSGDYTVRLKMPDGYRIAPHWHPLRENVTVISGTFKVGMGDRFDETKMGAFQAGSFAFLDPDMHHYAMASGECVVQVHGAAPLKFNYINASDDPSHNK
jgi:quercetin dioxygenase-like cupin family protein